jgi:hypothetical protein
MYWINAILNLFLAWFQSWRRTKFIRRKLRWISTTIHSFTSQTALFTVTTVKVWTLSTQDKKRFGNVPFIITITEFQVSIATNCKASTRGMNVSYAVGHELVSSLLFQCIVSILWVLITFWCGYMECSILYRGDGSCFTMEFVRIIRGSWH